jgi:hypothetical protein
MVKICSSASSTHTNFYFLIFGGISKFLSLGRFWQILAVLGNFGQIWVEFAALTVVESMPKARLKYSKPHNS